MLKTYKKGLAVILSNNFKSTEFDCHGAGCCSSTIIDDDLIKYLQKIRDHFNKPITITSGYRCNIHNKNIGGATGSRHSKGQAADIVVSGVAPREVAKYAESIGIKGIGLYETNADGHFTHIDTRTVKSFWYGQKEEYRSTFGGAELQNDKEDIKIDTSKVNTATADPKVMWNYFKKKGLNDYGIAGLMGNLYAESGLKPCNLQNGYEKTLGMTDAEYTAAVDTGVYTNFVKDQAGYGLAQWTYWSLKEDMLKYFQEKNKSIGDLETQMEFLVHQLSTNYKSVWTTLQTAKSVLEASNAVLLKFERPADQSITIQNKRASYGQKYFDAYGTAKNNIEVPSENKNDKMKYSESNKPLICMQTQSTCYKSTTTMTIKGVLWHSTGANNPNLKRYIQPSDNAIDKDEWLKLLGTNAYKNDWNHISHQAGLNCWIGKLADGTVTTIQTMPWNYKPWGCGSGLKGSCNNGWIQFEICEDGLTNKDYFEKVYEEACQITAYLCDLYNIDPNGTVKVNGVEIPTILCHADSYDLGFGSNHGDINHWFPKFNKNMNTARARVSEIMGKTNSKPSDDENNLNLPTEIYRVRKTWTDSKSQIGAYRNLENAKKARDKAGPEYEVYNSKGISIYPEVNNEIKTSFKVGDEVCLVKNATYYSGKEIPKWVFERKLYIREVYKDNYVISTQKIGPITGIVALDAVVAFDGQSIETSVFNPYLTRITTPVLNVRLGPGISYKITTQVKENQIYTIIDEKNGWGKLKSGAGWISLDYTEKLIKQ